MYGPEARPTPAYLSVVPSIVSQKFDHMFYSSNT